MWAEPGSEGRGQGGRGRTLRSRSWLRAGGYSAPGPPPFPVLPRRLPPRCLPSPSGPPTPPSCRPLEATALAPRALKRPRPAPPLLARAPRTRPEPTRSPQRRGLADRTTRTQTSRPEAARAHCQHRETGGPCGLHWGAREDAPEGPGRVRRGPASSEVLLGC